MSEQVFVYVIGHDAGPQKVGFSGCPAHRARCLKMTGQPHFTVHCQHAVDFNDVLGVERLAHHILADHAVGGEWFAVSPEVAGEAVRDAVARYAAGERAPPREDLMTKRLTLMLPASLIARIDDWRVTRPGRIPSFSEAVRALVDEAVTL